MILFLSGNAEDLPYLVKAKIKYVLMSYYSIKKLKDDELRTYRKAFTKILVDSGAFTFLNHKRIKKDIATIDAYAKQYGEWLEAHKWLYDYFVELDVEKLTGIERVHQYRQMLEQKAGQQCIPIWHIKRGIDYWKQLVKEYKYIGIGGLVIGEIKTPLKVVPSLVHYAHKHGVKVHGMGYTQPRNLQRMLFDSVDSTSWMSASRFARYHIYGGDGRLYTIGNKELAKRGKVVPRRRKRWVDDLNLRAWRVYAKYLEGVQSERNN